LLWLLLHLSVNIHGFELEFRKGTSLLPCKEDIFSRKMKRLLIYIVKSALKLATCKQEEKNSPIAYSSQIAILILVICLIKSAVRKLLSFLNLKRIDYLLFALFRRGEKDNRRCMEPLRISFQVNSLLVSYFLRKSRIALQSII